MKVCPGRYFIGMWFMNIPEHLTRFGKGGDLMALVWRHDHEPNIWHTNYRFRHYVGEEVWNSNDFFSHYEMVVPNVNEQDVETRTAAWMRNCSLGSGAAPAVEYLSIHGGPEAFYEAIHREKPGWLHMQEGHAE